MISISGNSVTLGVALARMGAAKHITVKDKCNRSAARTLRRARGRMPVIDAAKTCGK
jgi:hypothetical protein